MLNTRHQPSFGRIWIYDCHLPSIIRNFILCILFYSGSNLILIIYCDFQLNRDVCILFFKEMKIERTTNPSRQYWQKLKSIENSNNNSHSHRMLLRKEIVVYVQ